MEGFPEGVRLTSEYQSPNPLKNKMENNKGLVGKLKGLMFGSAPIFLKAKERRF